MCQCKYVNMTNKPYIVVKCGIKIGLLTKMSRYTVSSYWSKHVLILINFEVTDLVLSEVFVQKCVFYSLLKSHKLIGKEDSIYTNAAFSFMKSLGF